MKPNLLHFCTIFFLFSLTFNSHSQDVYVIDKSEKTKLLFDESDPRSFINVLQSNSYVISDLKKKGISLEDLEKFTNDEKSYFVRCEGEQSTEPLIDNDPESPGFGEEVILLDTATGDYYFAYPDPDSLLFSLQDIDRVVLEFEEGKETAMEFLQETTFFRKKEGEYIPVLQLYGAQWLHMDGYQLITEVPEEVKESMLAKGYWEQLRDTSVNWKDEYRKEIYFLHYQHYRGDYYTPIRDLDNYDDRFAYCYAEETNVPYKDEFIVEMMDHPNEEVEFMRTKFDSIVAYYEYSEFPALNEDPDSPTYGEWLYVIDDEGNMRYLYYQDPVFQWIEFEPTFYLFEVLTNQTGTEMNSLKSELIATSEADGVQQQVLNHVLTAPWLELIGGDLNYFNWGDWYSSINDALLSGKKYNLSKQKHRDKLKLSESYYQD